MKKPAAGRERRAKAKPLTEGYLMTIIEDRLAALETVQLKKGGHSSPDAGLCLMEAVAYVVGAPHSDRPACTSSLLGSFGRNLNDVLPDVKRQLLVPFIPRMVGTAGDGKDAVRGLMCADWLIRVYTPTWLRLAGSLTPVAGELTLDDLEALAFTYGGTVELDLRTNLYWLRGAVVDGRPLEAVGPVQS